MLGYLILLSLINHQNLFMKNQNILVLLSGLFFLTFTACNNAPAGEKVEAKDAVAKTSVSADKSVELDAASCKINWEGTKAMGGGHQGTINIQKGNLDIKDGQLVGGNITIDMNSLADVDLADANKKAKLEGHLKSDDFFAVANHPTATFEIVKATPDAAEKGAFKVTGNLTIKGITKSIEIPAKMEITDKMIALKTPPFTINRTEWDIKFHSGLMGTPKDMIINDNIGLSIVVEATL